MKEDKRVWMVRQILIEYVKSPSLRHIRDPNSLNKLARDIVKAIDRNNEIWRKWDGQREVLLKSALGCWIPIADLRDILNLMPGPQLTKTDVEQRLRAFEDEEYYSYPKQELQPGCLALYEKEKAEGTELPAIMGLLRYYVESEEERLRIEQEERYARHREEERLAKEQRLFSGADCKWTQLKGSKCWYCRTNGRTYRLSPTDGKLLQLDRVQTVSDDEEGELLGRYQWRRNATKVVAQIAYQPERGR